MMDTSKWKSAHELAEGALHIISQVSKITVHTLKEIMEKYPETQPLVDSAFNEIEKLGLYPDKFSPPNPNFAEDHKKIFHPKGRITHDQHE